MEVMSGILFRVIETFSARVQVLNNGLLSIEQSSSRHRRCYLPPAGQATTAMRCSTKMEAVVKLAICRRSKFASKRLESHSILDECT